MWEKIIIHSHIDNCYIQIEEMMYPHLKNVPMAICQKNDENEEVILAFNKKARFYDICLGETLHKAYKKCPNLVVVHPHFEDYLFYSEEIKNIYREYTNYVENDDLDDAWIDLTSSQCLFGGDPIFIAKEIQQHVYKEFGITVSMGVSYHKLFAKLVNYHQNDMSFHIASKKNYQDIIYPLPIEHLGIEDRMMLAELKSRSIFTIGDIARSPKEILKDIVGKNGEMIWLMLNGKDTAQTTYSNEIKCPQSIGNGVCLPYQLKTFEDMKFVLQILAKTLSTRLNDYGLKGYEVIIHIRNNELNHYINKKRLNSAVYSSIDILNIAEELLLEEWFKNYQFYLGKSDCRISMSIRQLVDITSTTILDQNIELATIHGLKKLHSIHELKKTYLGWYNDFKEVQPQCS